jgi:hypothetical protein
MISFIFGSKPSQLSINVIIYGKGNLENVESVGINMLERVHLLVLDQFFEGADFFVTIDVDREDVTGIIAVNKAIELEWERHATSMEESKCHLLKSRFPRVRYPLAQ